jgi:hypothetical protein
MPPGVVKVIVTVRPLSVPPVVGVSNLACDQVAVPPWVTANVAHASGGFGASRMCTNGTAPADGGSPTPMNSSATASVMAVHAVTTPPAVLVRLPRDSLGIILVIWPPSAPPNRLDPAASPTATSSINNQPDCHVRW